MKIETININQIKERDNNPNVMTKKEIEALKKSINKFGDLVPLIIDQNNVLIDGHQRKKVYLELNKKEVSIIRLNLEKESDKKLLSQILNKLKGSHDPALDIIEFKEILKDIDLQELTEITAISEQEILNLLNKSEKELAEEVDKLGKLMVTCPKCNHRFQKKEGK